jgi:hypothetical protein
VRKIYFGALASKISLHPLTNLPPVAMSYSTTNGFGGPMDGCSNAYTTILSTTMA